VRVTAGRVSYALLFAQCDEVRLFSYIVESLDLAREEMYFEDRRERVVSLTRTYKQYSLLTL